ncbi:hypothetical protein ACHWQZ_G002637 [Mnemiopsis leidyi]
MGENVDLSNVDAHVNGSNETSKKSNCFMWTGWTLGLEDVSMGLLQKCGAEFLGTMFLIVFCVGSANSTILQSLGSASLGYYLSISIAFGFGIGGIVHILSSTSGGHVNPAVSLAFFLDGRVSLLVALAYIVAQFAGGFAGAGILYEMGNFKENIEDGRLQSISGGNAVSASISQEHAFFLEMFGTIFLILTILSTIDKTRGHAPSYLQPLAIGIAILVMHIFLIFLFAPLVGSVVAVPLHRAFFKPHF